MPQKYIEKQPNTSLHAAFNKDVEKEFVKKLFNQWMHKIQGLKITRNAVSIRLRNFEKFVTKINHKKSSIKNRIC